MRSILLCVDGSSYSTVCTKYAIELARLMDAYVDVLYVTNLNSFELSVIADCGGSLGVQPFQDTSANLQDAEREKFQRLERRITRMFDRARYGTKFKFNHRTGTIVGAFEEFKNDATGLDLVIVGKRGESSGTETDDLGASIEQILRACSCPCFVAPATFRPSLKNILLAYDASEGANKAIQFVERNHFFKDCQLHVLMVNPEDDTKAQFRNACTVLHDIAGLNLVAAEKFGNIVDEIEKYIAENHIDLLATGSYSHSIIRHFFVGSTTSNIVKRSTIPVVVFK